MLEAALASVRQIFTPPYRSVLYKVLGITLVLLTLVWLGLDKIIVNYIAVPYPWLATTLTILTGIGLFFGLAFIVAPTSSLVAGLFLDELAEEAERETAPLGPHGRALPAGQAMWLAAKFAGVSLLVNFLALLLFLIPGVNALVFFIANAYLLGREYFELAALRYHPLEEVRALRRTHMVRIFFAGFFIAAFLAVPILNLLTPLFGTAFMVRFHNRVVLQKRPGFQQIEIEKA
jgi:CysZ protein